MQDSCNIGILEPPPCAVTEVEHFYLFLFFQHAEYRAINVRLVAIEQVPELVALGCQRASARLFFQTENCFLEPSVPFQDRVGMFAVDRPIQWHGSLWARDVMLTRYAMPGFEILEKLSAAPCLVSRPPDLDGFLCIGACGNVEQMLIGSCVLHDGRRLTFHR